MNYLLLPDLFAMSLLVGVLLSLRGRRENRNSLRLWTTGLMMILAECLARIIYMLPGNPLWLHRGTHVVALDAYLLAGALFLLSACVALRSMPLRNAFVFANAMPLLALLTTYGLESHTREHYLLCAAAVPAVMLGCRIFLRAHWMHLVPVVVLWTPLLAAILLQDYRFAAYLSLFLVYALCAIAFGRSLPSRSRGKIAVVAGFTTWALCFGAHPWLVRDHPQWAQFSSEIWNMQKFIITVGLLVVMLEQQLEGTEWLAQHDALTGLANRRCFDERLQQAVTRAEVECDRVALFTLDLDGLKQINDTLGHDAGDILLRQVAIHLSHAVGSMGTVARLGGDEFCLIAPLSPSAECEAKVVPPGIQAAMLKAIQQPVHLGPDHGELVVEISASIGVAVFPEDSTDAAMLMRLADARMYQEKHQRRQRRNGESSSIIRAASVV